MAHLRVGLTARDSRMMIGGCTLSLLILALVSSPGHGDDPPRPSAKPQESTPSTWLQTLSVPPGGAPHDLRGSYIAALQQLGAGNRRDAIDAIVAIELSETAGNAAREADRLSRAGRALAVKMAELDSESLVPVMVLRHDLVGEYRRRGEPILGRLAGELAITSAELYASSSTAEEAHELAGGVVSSLGGDAQEHGALPTARTLFEHALELDESCAPALLGLGAYWELVGRYDLAAASFSRLRTAHPDDVEGVLRLGVNLIRLKRYDHGIAALRSCVRDDAPAWIVVVASEEWARALIASGRLREAEQVLRDATRRHPEETSLHVELAYVLDLARRPVEARAALAEVSGTVAPDEPSPRVLYCRWPSHTLAVTRAELERAAASRLAAMARVLTRIAETGA